MVVQRRIPGAGTEGGHIEHRHQDDAALHVGKIQRAHHPAHDHRAFVLVAMVGAEGHQPFAGAGLRADQHRQRDQVVAPDRVMLERDPVVAPAGAFQIEFVGAADQAFHQMLLCVGVS